MKLQTLISVVADLLLVCLASMPEPFLLPFGPKQTTDKIKTKAIDSCSEEVPLSRSVKYGGERYESLYVCEHGFLSFGKRYTDAQYPDLYDFDEVSNAVIAPYFSDIGLFDNLLDYGCLFTNYDLSADNFYPQEASCLAYHNDDIFKQKLNDDYIVNDFTRQDVIDHSNTELNGVTLEITSDDELSLDLFGKFTTKYPNLANNVFFRESTASADLAIVEQLIQSKAENNRFHPNWLFVATWYKVGALNGRLDAFNSFQAILACDENEPDDEEDDECFVLFDYYELQWSYSRTLASEAQAFFKNQTG